MPAAQVKDVALYQGVSRQPETQRIPRSVHEAINCFPDLATGVRKRNGTEFRFALNVTNPTDTYSYEWILAGDGARFAMLLSDDATEPIQVFAIEDGRKVEVLYDNAAAKTYVSSGSAWRVLSVFDSTFIVNTGTTVALTGSAATYTVTDTLLDGTELPLAPTAGNIYKTLNSSVGRPAGYYEAKDPYSVNNVDPYTRLTSPEANSEFDPDTMPVQMIYDSTANSGDGSFTVQQPSWSPRRSGDSITNPGPSFVGRTINDLVFHKNRLWPLADEVVAASAAGDFFNFWLDDVYNSTAGDPIDEYVTDEGLNKIKYAIPFNKSLNLFTQGNRQFEVRSTGPMAPDSISIIPTTNYGASDTVRPIRLGSQMYFATPFTDHTQFFEYYYLENAANNVAREITEHVPRYITEEITAITGEENSGLMVTLAEGSTKAFPYKVLWGEEGKTQSAWSTWEFPDIGYKLMSCYTVADEIWFLVRVVGDTTTKYALISTPVEAGEDDPDVPYTIYLDYLQRFTSGTYDSGTHTTYWDLPYNAEDREVVVVLTEGDTPGFLLPTTITEQSEHVSRVTVRGDYATLDVTVGVPFDWSVQLNKPYVKDRNGTPITGSFSLKKLIVYIKDTVQFNISQVTPGIAQPYTSLYTSVQLASNGVLYNQVPVVDFDNPSFIMMGKAQDMAITLSDTSPFPVTLVSVEYRGTFNPRRQVR